MLRTKLPFFLAYAQKLHKPTFLEYVEFDGNSWIDTKYVPSSNTRVVGSVLFREWKNTVTDTTVANYVFGVFGNNQNYGFNVGSSRNFFNTPWEANSGINDQTKGIIPELNVKYNFDVSKEGTYINDVEYLGASRFTVTFQAQKTMFVGWSNGTSAEKMIGNIYGIKIYESDELIQDLYPALDPRGVVCFYDAVTKQYFYNQGTGLFIAGPRFIEYIKSTGTQYIDTGVYAPDVTRFVVKGTCEPNGMSNAQLLGAKDSSAATSFFGSRIVSGKQSWYCVVGDSTSIGNPLNLSIIDATIVDDKNQPGTLTDLVEGTTQSFESFVGSTSNFAFLENNLCIFGGSATRASLNATCYELQIYTANGLVRHFKPCIDGNNVKCMYDLVTGKYYYNQGEGEFVVGSESSSN